MKEAYLAAVFHNELPRLDGYRGLEAESSVASLNEQSPVRSRGGRRLELVGKTHPDNPKTVFSLRDALKLPERQVRAFVAARAVLGTARVLHHPADGKDKEEKHLSAMKSVEEGGRENAPIEAVLPASRLVALRRHALANDRRLRPIRLPLVINICEE